MTRPRLASVLFCLCAAAALWSAAVALTGGFVARPAGIPISSRSPLPAALFSLIFGCASFILWPPGRREDVFSSLIAAMAGAAVVIAAFWKGAFVAGGADMYGYVSQAHLWATGSLHVEQPLLHELTRPYLHDALAPLGYRPAQDGPSIVPVYSAGLPVLMALFERLGGRQAVFYVVPLLGGVVVWATYVMGARLVRPVAGAAAALLMATSPVLLGQVLLPMSDVPVAAWWSVTLALLTWERRDAALGAGLAAGMAILTRPNLAPLVLVALGLVCHRLMRSDTPRKRGLQRLALLAAGVAAGCVAVALINTHLYGSPLLSGYGKLRDLYEWQHLVPNLQRYPVWMTRIHTPIVLLAPVAPFLVRWWRQPGRANDAHPTSVAWLLFAIGVFLSYLFYRPYDDWAFLRFILPALPPLLVLTVAALLTIAKPLRSAAPVVVLIVAAAVSWERLQFSVRGRTFEIGEFERKYVAIGEYIRNKLPERAVLLSMEHSGSARYYSGRLTLRYDYIPGPELDPLIRELQQLGYHPYILLDEWELPDFQPRFRRDSQLGALDWAPAAWLDHSSKTRIYDPRDRDAAANGRSVQTDIIY